MRWFSIHRLSAKGYRPRGFRVHTANKIDRCALAGTIRSDQTENLTFVDGEVQIIHRFDAAEMFGQTTEFKHWFFPDFPAQLHASGLAWYARQTDLKVSGSSQSQSATRTLCCASRP